MSLQEVAQSVPVDQVISELKERITIVIVSHNMLQTTRVADTSACRLEGELIEHGPTTAIFTKPNDERAERYVTGKPG